MKRFTLIVAASMLIASTATGKADRLPYFGGEPFNGSYLNGPLADYPYASGWGPNSGYYAYAMGSCRTLRTRHVSSSGKIFYRTNRVCG